jgi:hypothetical protein
VPEGKSSEAVLCDVVSNAERASVARRVVTVPVRGNVWVGSAVCIFDVWSTLYEVRCELQYWACR